MEEKIGLFVHPAFKEWAQPFEDKYQMANFLMVGDTAFRKPKKGKQKGRLCIFCNKSYPETSFKNAAHLLPKMIGNTDLYSSFECDACNSKFSSFETDLASFLGLGRSISGMNDSGKTPGFPGIGLEAKSIIYKSKKLLVMNVENAERKSVEGNTKMKYKKPAYTPSNVYKLFLKCALSILPNDEVVKDFRLALMYLQGGGLLNGAQVNIFKFPLTVKMPLHVCIYKKREATDKLPVYIASFYFNNFVITIPVLLHRDDLRSMNKPIQLPTAPPYFVYGNDIDRIVPSFSSHDLSSSSKLKCEPEEITMQFDKSILEKMSRFDPETGEITQTVYNPRNSKYIIATEEGAVFTKEELIELSGLINREFSIKN